MVSLQVNYRTHYNPEGLVAIVYDVNPKTGGIKVCCQHGVITHDGGKGHYWVPADKYIIRAPVGMLLPLSDDLAQVRKMIEEGIFDGEECPRISYSKMHQLQIAANSPIKKSKGCGCKKGKCGSSNISSPSMPIVLGWVLCFLMLFCGHLRPRRILICVCFCCSVCRPK